MLNTRVIYSWALKPGFEELRILKSRVPTFEEPHPHPAFEFDSPPFRFGMALPFNGGMMGGDNRLCNVYSEQGSFRKNDIQDRSPFVSNNKHKNNDRVNWMEWIMK
jgi:hypothetical protein